MGVSSTISIPLVANKNKIETVAYTIWKYQNILVEGRKKDKKKKEKGKKKKGKQGKKDKRKKSYIRTKNMVK